MTPMDSHAHLDFFARQHRLDDCLDRAWKGGLKGIITLGTSPRDWAEHRRIASADDRIAFTVGLHPTEIDGGQTLKSIGDGLEAAMVGPKRPVAIGEIGLDYHRPQRDPNEWERQRAVFSLQMELAKRWELPVVIHCRDVSGRRDAWRDCLTILDRIKFDGQRACMHCFSYGCDEMKAWMGRGSAASFTGVITYDSADEIRRAMALEPLDRIMFETDSPFLLPAMRRRDADENEPLFVRDIIRYAAGLLHVPSADLIELADRNPRHFFGL